MAVQDFLTSKVTAHLKKLSAEGACRSVLVIYEDENAEFTTLFGGDIDILSFFEEVEGVEERLQDYEVGSMVPLTILRGEAE